MTGGGVGRAESSVAPRTGTGHHDPRDEHHHDDHHHDEHGGEPAILAGEQITLVSAGIDIGSATSHLLISELELRRQGVALSSGYVVIRRDIRFRSPVILTPYSAPDRIDAAALQTFVDASYADAGVSADEIDTGAVIVTGEAARKHNAEAITHIFSTQSGKFVCAVAGPLLEARLAVHGSGAVQLSTAEPERPVLNLDIGGGTAKVSLLRGGIVEEAVVVNVGARLIAWDDERRVIRTERAGELAARQCGARVDVGSRIDEGLADAVAAWLGDRLFAALTTGTTGFDDDLLVAGVPFRPPPGSAVVVSGGVGEYVYGEPSAVFGDLGPAIARAVRGHVCAPDRQWELVPAAQRIRSTAIGASQFTVQVSGNTIFVADVDALPLRNVPVVHVSLTRPDPTPAEVEEAVTRALALADSPAADAPLALAVHGRITASYPNLRGFCVGLRAAHERAGSPVLIVVLDQDVAGLVGNLLARELHMPNVICIDQVSLRGLDYIDIGALIPDAKAVPVMAKSLLFGVG